MENLLLEYANGLDTAGSPESDFFEVWYQEMQKGTMTKFEIMTAIRNRYSENNMDVVQEFEKALNNGNSSVAPVCSVCGVGAVTPELGYDTCDACLLRR